MDEIEIHKKLKLLRKERGLTLNNLADKIGSDYQQISRIERGKSKLTIEVLMKIAKALETPLSDIMDDTPASMPHAKEEEPHHSPAQRERREEKKNQSVYVMDSEELLSKILEKIEHLLDESNVKLQPGVRAALASKIYSQANELLRSNSSDFSIDSFITFSLSLIKSILSGYSK